MNGPASFMPRIHSLSQRICRWHRSAKHDLRLRATEAGSGLWKGMRVISNGIKPACHLLCIKMSISVPVLILEGNFSAEWKWWGFFEKANLPSKCSLSPASLIYFTRSIPSWLPCIKIEEIALGSVWLRFSFKSYWHYVQWPCYLWELLGPLTEVVKHLDWLGRCEMCAVMAYCRLYVRTTCRELHGLLCHR